MNAALAALEASPPAALLRTSFYVYPLLNALHILALGALLTSVLLMDVKLLGGLRRFAEAEIVALLRPLAITALLVAVASGVLLFSVRPFEYLDNPAFPIKLWLLAAAVTNALVFQVLPRRSAAVKPLALLSVLLWPSVLVAGRFIGFLQ